MATAKSVASLPRERALGKISTLCLSNAAALLEALHFCRRAGIGCFRVGSHILPLRTHPTLNYELDELPDCMSISETFRQCRDYAEEHNLRLTFHPDQFVVLSSPLESVVSNSIRELEYHGEVAEWIGADVINVHIGGAYGDRRSSLRRFAENAAKLSERVCRRLTVENDDVVYTVEDILPLCEQANIPLVYDVHHHRCLPDKLSVDEATHIALKTWDREPLFHISSPKAGWNGPQPRCHHDFIMLRDFPKGWLELDVTVEVEAKAKELAVRRLQRAVNITQ